MNYIVIKNEKMKEAKERYGDNVVSSCLDMAKEKHPSLVYAEMNDNGDDSKECFLLLFGELIVV